MVANDIAERKLVANLSYRVAIRQKSVRRQKGVLNQMPRPVSLLVIANRLLSIAPTRNDCCAFVGPKRAAQFVRVKLSLPTGDALGQRVRARLPEITRPSSTRRAPDWFWASAVPSLPTLRPTAKTKPYCFPRSISGIESGKINFINRLIGFYPRTDRQA